jgi:hypothetical protein
VATRSCALVATGSLAIVNTGEIVFSRMRKGSAGSSRGVVCFVDELAAIVRRAGATSAITVRADWGFWSWKLIDTLNRHRSAWSITVTSNTKNKATIYTIPVDAWQDIDSTASGFAQVAEATYTVGRRGSRKLRTVRLVVRRTHFTDTAQGTVGNLLQGTWLALVVYGCAEPEKSGPHIACQLVGTVG